MPRLQAFPGDRLLMLDDTIIFCNARATVRHPYVLGVVETTETASGMIYVVTEKVSVLSDVLNGCTPSGIAWGLYTTLTAVSFLNKECQLVHGNVSRCAPERAPPNPPSPPHPKPVRVRRIVRLVHTRPLGTCMSALCASTGRWHSESCNYVCY